MNESNNKCNKKNLITLKWKFTYFVRLIIFFKDDRIKKKFYGNRNEKT